MIFYLRWLLPSYILQERKKIKHCINLQTIPIDNSQDKILTGLFFHLWHEHGVEWKAEKCSTDGIMWFFMDKKFRHRVVCISTESKAFEISYESEALYDDVV